MMAAVGYSIWDNGRYAKVSEKHNGRAPPEARLPPALIGSVCLPVGLFWFAWTNSPSIHWIVSIIATAPFGFGMVLVFLSIMNYLIDSYVIYAASVLAANSVLRSLFGAAFPLFTTCKSTNSPPSAKVVIKYSLTQLCIDMYNNLGIHWASSIPAFLALMCVPFPFLFYKYGEQIRMRCKFAAEAANVLERMRTKTRDERVLSIEEEIDGEEETETDFDTAKREEGKEAAGESNSGLESDGRRERDAEKANTGAST